MVVKKDMLSELSIGLAKKGFTSSVAPRNAFLYKAKEGLTVRVEVNERELDDLEKKVFFIGMSFELPKVLEKRECGIEVFPDFKSLYALFEDSFAEFYPRLCSLKYDFFDKKMEAKFVVNYDGSKIEKMLFKELLEESINYFCDYIFLHISSLKKMVDFYSKYLHSGITNSENKKCDNSK